MPDADLIERLGVDVRGLYPRNSHNWQMVETEVQDEKSGELYWSYHDEWGITHRKPRPDGLYYSLWQAPLDKPELTAEDIRKHPWPTMADPHAHSRTAGKSGSLPGSGLCGGAQRPFAGIFEMAQRIVGMENLLMMMASEPQLAGALFDQLTELKLAFWEMALPQLADVVDVISQADDYGTQVSQIISPRMFRQQIKPRWKVIFDRVRSLAPNARRFFHSCGNVRPLIAGFYRDRRGNPQPGAYSRHGHGAGGPETRFWRCVELLGRGGGYPGRAALRHAARSAG